jgi:histidinol-phosphatase (PHP family)
VALAPDLHVHTEFSYDAPSGSMERSCARALQIGLPAIAFTDHADFVTIHKDQHCVDIGAYLDAIERCRSKFKNLRILSGVELGEPHWFPRETAAVLAAAELDRVLGSVHCVHLGSEIVDGSQFRFRPAAEHSAAVREYFRETLAMVESQQPFEVLAHLDYPKRYWPDGVLPYREEDYEVELRAVLAAAAKRGCILEVNTTRGEEGKLCPGPTVLRWWRELGGDGVTLGSDAHDPDKIAAGFDIATAVIEAAGFKPAPEPTALWRR